MQTFRATLLAEIEKNAQQSFRLRVERETLERILNLLDATVPESASHSVSLQSGDPEPAAESVEVQDLESELASRAPEEVSRARIY